MYTVTYGVKGSHRVHTASFATREQADERARRWRASNSQGSYWAKVDVTSMPAPAYKPSGARWDTAQFTRSARVAARRKGLS